MLWSEWSRQILNSQFERGGRTCLQWFLGTGLALWPVACLPRILCQNVKHSFQRSNFQSSLSECWNHIVPWHRMCSAHPLNCLWKYLRSGLDDRKYSCGYGRKLLFSSTCPEKFHFISQSLFEMDLHNRLRQFFARIRMARTFCHKAIHLNLLRNFCAYLQCSTHPRNHICKITWKHTSCSWEIPSILKILRYKIS